MKWRVIACLLLAICLVLASATKVSADSTTDITGTVPSQLQCSNVSATNIGYYGVTIQWQTNLNATSRVYYDTISRTGIDDYRYMQEDPTPVTAHSVRLTNLDSGTRYYYRVRSTAAGNLTCISPEYTFTTRTPPLPPGPPGPPSPPRALYLQVIISGVSSRYEISAEGELLERVERTSPDGKLTIMIPRGAIVLDKDGKRLESLTVDFDHNPPCPPPQGAYVILPYKFGPSGATFTPPITLTWHYDQADIPEGVSEKDLIVAYCNKDTRQWVPVPSVVNVDTNVITATVSRFTTFAIIGAPAVQYNITISSTTGGSVTTPGEGTFTYDAGTVVNLVATPDAGYRFVNWTGNVGTIANVNAASTTIAMNGNYSITANFEKIPPPPKKCPLICWIIPAAVIVGLVIFFIRRRRKAT